jgi:hypothetical protein
MKVKFFRARRDFWIGFYWDGPNRTLYVMILPTLGFKVVFKEKK